MGGKGENKRLFWLAGLAGMVMAMQAGAATLTVDTTSDGNLTACTAAPGDCSLRGALTRAQDAALQPGDDTIHFNIPMSDANCNAGTGVCTITLSSEIYTGMSTIAQGGLTIDGYTQPGASANTLPFSEGSNAQIKIQLRGSGWNFTAPITLRGFAFGIPVNIQKIGGLCCGTPTGSGRYEVEGNVFGLLADGVTPSPAPSGILLFISITTGNIDGVRIGGALPAQRNVFGSFAGFDATTPWQECLRISGTNHIVQNNLIGTDRSGLLPRGCGAGVLLDGTGTLIGGAGADQGNVISSHVARALQLDMSTGGLPTRLIGNLIGTGIDGTTPLPNMSQDAAGAVFSSVSGNATANAVRIQDNLIAYSGHTRPRFPSTPPFRQTPAISNNGHWEVQGNRFLGNRGQPIYLSTSSSSHLPNDADDADGAAHNRKQNFPVISAFSRVGNTVNLTYVVDSTPANSQYPLNIEFYRDNGQGELLPIGQDVYTQAEAQTPVTTSFTLPAGITLTEGQVVVGMATSAPQPGEQTGETGEMGFYPMTLIYSSLPANVRAGQPATIQMRATALTGPFPPNGVVTVTLHSSPSASCELSLMPGPGAFESTGECTLIPTQAGNFTLQAYYDAPTQSFAATDGSGLVVNAVLPVAAPGPEQISFASCRAIALEGRNLLVRINRPSGATANVSVTLEHLAGTATAGTDYTAPATQTLSWAAGDMAAKVVTIPIASDGVAEPVETFRLRLINPVNTAIVPNSQMEVSILDGDAQGFRDGFEGDCPL